jgi:uncharacterized protein Yka (UPF0111/DUF47 family)/energy-coupling factor transporter ATP-binding protein EcfA2
MARPRDSVVISEDEEFYKVFYSENECDMNDYIKSWKILDVIEHRETGYLGIIYVNDTEKQLVLAHRSSNFKSSVLPENLMRGSGAQEDVAGILMGQILTHQAYGYLATDIAVKIITGKYLSHLGYEHYALSTTGHSLGAWLAELSLFYCHTDLGYKNVKAVTFDGPGSYEMMKQMSASEIKGGNTNFNKKDLDIVAYLSAPNIVNCANKHVGTAYRLFPEIKENIFPFMKKIIGQTAHDALHATWGHHMKYILPYFDPITGQPKKCSEIIKWPSITHKNYGQGVTKNLWDYIGKSILGSILPQQSVKTAILKKLGFDTSNTVLSNVFDNEPTTLGCFAHLLYDLAKGNIKQESFWIAHEYLNKGQGYKESFNNKIEYFQLLYKGKYQVSQKETQTRKIKDDIDRYLKLLKAPNVSNIQGELGDKIANLVKFYEYKPANKGLEITKRYQPIISIEVLRDIVREMVHRDDLAKCIDKANLPMMSRWLGDIRSQSNYFIDFDNKVDYLKEAFKANKAVIIKGPIGAGKTMLAQEYAKKFLKYFTPVLLDANSKKSLANSIKTYLEKSQTRSFVQDIDNVIEAFYDILESNDQKVLFILDNAKSYNDISYFIEAHNALTNVYFLITTRCDNLIHNKYTHKNISAIRVNQLDHEQASTYLEAGDVNREYIANKIEQNNQALINLLRKLSLDKSYNFLLKAISLIKTDHLSAEELTDNLINANKAKSISSALDVLRKESIITTSYKNTIVIEQKTQEILLNLLEYSSAWDFLEYISLFRPSEVNMKLIVNRLVSYDTSVLNVDIDQFCVSQGMLTKKVALSMLDFVKQILDDVNLPHDNIELSSSLTRLGVFLMKHAYYNNEPLSLLDRERNIVEKLAELENREIQYPEDIHNKTSVLFLGPSQIGKSTLVNYLSGIELRIKKAGVKYKIENGGGMAIGDGSGIAETKIPAFKEIEDNFVLWDCPGLNDTDPVQAIINAPNIQKLINNIGNYKVVFPLSHRGHLQATTIDPMVSELNHLAALFSNNLDKIGDSLLFIITQFEGDDEDKEYSCNTIVMNSLRNIYDNSSKLSIHGRQLVEILMEKQKFASFKIPERESGQYVLVAGDKQSILTKIYDQELKLLDIRDVNSILDTESVRFIDDIRIKISSYIESEIKKISSEINDYIKSNCDRGEPIDQNKELKELLDSIKSTNTINLFSNCLQEILSMLNASEDCKNNLKNALMYADKMKNINFPIDLTQWQHHIISHESIKSLFELDNKPNEADTMIISGIYTRISDVINKMKLADKATIPASINVLGLNKVLFDKPALVEKRLHGKNIAILSPEIKSLFADIEINTSGHHGKDWSGIPPQDENGVGGLGRPGNPGSHGGDVYIAVKKYSPNMHQQADKKPVIKLNISGGRGGNGQTGGDGADGKDGQDAIKDIDGLKRVVDQKDAVSLNNMDRGVFIDGNNMLDLLLKFKPETEQDLLELKEAMNKSISDNEGGLVIYEKFLRTTKTALIIPYMDSIGKIFEGTQNTYITSNTPSKIALKGLLLNTLPSLELYLAAGSEGTKGQDGGQGGAGGIGGKAGTIIIKTDQDYVIENKSTSDVLGNDGMSGAGGSGGKFGQAYYSLSLNEKVLPLLRGYYNSLHNMSECIDNISLIEPNPDDNRDMKTLNKFKNVPNYLMYGFKAKELILSPFALIGLMVAKNYNISQGACMESEITAQSGKKVNEKNSIGIQQPAYKMSLDICKANINFKNYLQSKIEQINVEKNKGIQSFIEHFIEKEIIKDFIEFLDNENPMEMLHNQNELLVDDASHISNSVAVVNNGNFDIANQPITHSVLLTGEDFSIIQENY